MAYLDLDGLSRVFERLGLVFLRKSSVVNNLTTTAAGCALDARQGKALKTAVDGKASAAAKTATLAASGWTKSGDVYTQTVSVSGVTASNRLIVSAAPGSFLSYCEAQAYASAQSAGSVSFTAVYQPEDNLTVNLLIVE